MVAKPIEVFKAPKEQSGQCVSNEGREVWGSPPSAVVTNASTEADNAIIV